MILIGAANVTLGSIGASVSEAHAEQNSVAQTQHANLDLSPDHSELTHSHDDPFQGEEERNCPDGQHTSCHTCHFGHCNFTTVAATVMFGLNQIGLRSGGLSTFYLDVNLSGPTKPPRA